MITSRLLAKLSTARRCICTSARLDFKFKMTDEMAREWNEQQKKAKSEMEDPPQALHTREGSLIMGRVSHERYDKVVKIGVPKHRLNEYYLLYVRENDDVQAYDEFDQCKPGDWVLLKRQENPIDTNVAHKVERVIYSYGKYIDPLTGRRSLGLYYDDDMETLEKIKLEL